jgi:thiol-disulfide isomerase/thioredoxin
MEEKYPVVVEFWHERCPYCKKMKPIYDQMPGRLGHKAKIARLNLLESRDNRNLAIDQNVLSTPTFKVYCNGRSKGEIVGVLGLEEFAEELEKLIDSCKN